MLTNAGASILLYDTRNEARAKDLQQDIPLKLVLLPDFSEPLSAQVPSVESFKALDGDRKAMMLYTSGTVSSTVVYCCSMVS